MYCAAKLRSSYLYAIQGGRVTVFADAVQLLKRLKEAGDIVQIGHGALVFFA
jgi:hypothetical protein